MNSTQMSGSKSAAPPVDDSAARAALVARIRKCQQLPAALREQLLVSAGAAQFSGGAEKRTPGTIVIADLLAMYEDQAVQFSAGSPQANLVERIKRLKEATAIPAGIADQLLAKVGTVQFSAAGEESVATGGLSVSGIVGQYEQVAQAAGLMFGDRSAAYQLSAGLITNPGHPGGETYTAGKSKEVAPGSPEAIAQANAVLERTGMGTPINNDGTPKAPGARRLAINATEAFRAAG